MSAHESKDIVKLCQDKGLRLTEQRRIIAEVISKSSDHPDVEEVYRRAVSVDAKISMSTVYRTLKLFEELHILEKREFGDRRARYEHVGDHHDHLIDLETGKVIEFHSTEIEKLQEEIARKFGYRLVDHRLELFGLPLKSKK